MATLEQNFEHKNKQLRAVSVRIVLPECKIIKFL